MKNVINLLRAGDALLCKHPEMRMKHGDTLDRILKRHHEIKGREPRKILKTGSEK